MKMKNLIFSSSLILLSVTASANQFTGPCEQKAVDSAYAKAAGEYQYAEQTVTQDQQLAGGWQIGIGVNGDCTAVYQVYLDSNCSVQRIANFGLNCQ